MKVYVVKSHPCLLPPVEEALRNADVGAAGDVSKLARNIRAPGGRPISDDEVAAGASASLNKTHKTLTAIENGIAKGSIVLTENATRRAGRGGYPISANLRPNSFSGRQAAIRRKHATPLLECPTSQKPTSHY